MSLKRKLYDISGKVIGEIELPEVFNTSIRLDLIKRAYMSSLTSRIQPKGVRNKAGMRKSAESLGVGHGMARIPRIKGERYAAAYKGALAPSTRGGRAAHPPRPEKKVAEKINKREKRLAFMSALASTSHKDLVEGRGHRIPADMEPPVVVEGGIEEFKKTSEVYDFLVKLGLGEELKRCKERWKKIRPGVGKLRGRKRKKAKGPLIVVDNAEWIFKAGRNIPGVEVKTVNNLSVEDLSPGGVPGRLMIISKLALENLKVRFK